MQLKMAAALNPIIPAIQIGPKDFLDLKGSVSPNPQVEGFQATFTATVKSFDPGYDPGVGNCFLTPPSHIPQNKMFLVSNSGGVAVYSLLYGPVLGGPGTYTLRIEYSDFSLGILEETTVSETWEEAKVSFDLSMDPNPGVIPPGIASAVSVTFSVTITGKNGYVPSRGCQLYVDGEASGSMDLQSTLGTTCLYTCRVNFGAGEVGVRTCTIFYYDPIAMVVTSESGPFILDITQPVT